MQRVEVGEVIATVDFNGFQESDRHPQPDEDQVVAQEEDTPHEPHAQNYKIER